MAKISAIVFGIIFVIAGIWGLFAQPVLGFIAADRIGSIVHIIVGIVLLVLASKSSAATALKTVGIIYVILAILGFIQGSTILFGTFVTTAATTWFYLIAGLVIAILGFASGKKGGDVSAPMSTPTPSAPQM